jgi:hypothetical protein
MYCYTVTATNASGASAESSPPACTTTQAPPPPPETPTNLVATAVSPTQINVSWASSSGATAYILRRDSVVITNTTSTTYSDTGRSPETQYCYTIAATNAGGSSAQSPSVCATTPSVPPFAMDGNVDSSGYLIAENSGMKLWAAIKGATLYVATWSPGTNGPNDHFILVTDQLSPLQAAFPDWSKVGLNAVSTNAPFLGGESTSDYVGWQKTSAANLAAKSATSAGQMEGTLDLVQAFGSMPSTLYLAVAPYATTNGGGLVASAQVPAGNGNGNIEGNEFLVVPVPVIRDDNLDGKLDSLDPTRAFAVQSVTPYGGTGFIVSWPSLPAHSYQVQYTDDMTVSFQPLSGTLVALQGQFSMSYTDSTSSVGRFYRVKLVTPQAQPASDNAADAAYGSVWTNGSNGGTGFGPWVLTGTGTLGGWSNGFFIASSTNNAAGATPGIDVSGKSWGIYANNGNYTAAYRALTNGALQVGQSLLVSMDNGYIDSGNTVGFVLRNGNASASPSDYNVGARFEFFYQGFATSNSYKVVDMAGLKDIGVPWTGTGLRLVFTLTGTDTYTLLTINNSSGTTNTSGGTLAGTGTVDSIALYNRNAGDGGNYDAFFNSLQTIGP